MSGAVKKMDEECVELAKAMNRIKGVHTVSSCCGHGVHTYTMFFDIEKNNELEILLYYIDKCHIGFDWICRVYTDCSMAKPRYLLESKVIGLEAYKQSEIIAKHINEYLDGRDLPSDIREEEMIDEIEQASKEIVKDVSKCC